jgi:hypothetical protein
VYSTRSEAAARLIVAGIAEHQELLEKVYAALAQVRRAREQAQELVRPWKEEGTRGPKLPRAADRL